MNRSYQCEVIRPQPSQDPPKRKASGTPPIAKKIRRRQYLKSDAQTVHNSIAHRPPSQPKRPPKAPMRSPHASSQSANRRSMPNSIPKKVPAKFKRTRKTQVLLKAGKVAVRPDLPYSYVVPMNPLMRTQLRVKKHFIQGLVKRLLKKTISECIRN